VFICAEGGSAGRKIAFSDTECFFVNKLFCLEGGSNLLPKYIYYYLRSEAFQIQFKNALTGLIGGVSLSKIRLFDITYPSLSVQKQIIEKLDTVFTDIDKAISTTVKNIENTEALFLKHQNEILSSNARNWQTKKLQDICEHITDGTHQTPKYFDDGYIFLSSKNVKNKKIDWENIKYIDESQHLAMQKRLSPKKGDILLAKNGTTGVGAIVDRDLIFDIYVSLALIRSKGDVIPEYLLEVLNSLDTKKQFNERLKGTGVPNLHLKEIREVTVSYPISMEDQNNIVSKINQFEKHIDVLKGNYENKLSLLSALKSSLLNQAFSGELTKDAA